MLDLIIGIITGVFLFFYSFVAQPVEVKGNAMDPNYIHGQKYLVDKTSKDFKRGDVIVFNSPQNRDALYIKRIVGLPGETVKVEGGKVWINGKVLEESYLKDPLTSPGAFLNEGKEFLIPAESYIVLGDNRNQSSDSRSWGYIKVEDIIGKMGAKYSD